MSRKRILAVLEKLHRERRQLLGRLSAGHELAVGTVSLVQRKCGNPNCRCAEGDGHAQVQFLFKDEDGPRRCKLIRKADEDRFLRAGECYTEFRADLRRLNDINSSERKILMSLRDLRAIHYD